MLQVDTRVDRSPTDGLGLCAVVAIPKGTEVRRFTPGFDLDLHPDSLNALPAHARERLRRYGYVDRRLRRDILCCDDARFINHSETPNVCPDVSVARYGIDVAVRDIAAGEEITVDDQLVEGIQP
jgi:SET domain-containing protein